MRGRPGGFRDRRPRPPTRTPTLNASAGAEPVLRGEGLTKRFLGTVALDGVDLFVGAGETVALVGESGSGKTTLLRMFNALVVPDAGRVHVRGTAVDRVDPVELRRRTGYVPQEGGLLPHWTVLRNAGLVPALLGMDDARERAHDALERVGLSAETFGNRYPMTLSGGQRQRVALARALAADPDVVLLDEPFGALDALSREEVFGTFREALASAGASTLLVTHDLRVAVRLAHRVAVLRAGRILQVAPPDALLGAPADEYVARLLERGGVR